MSSVLETGIRNIRNVDRVIFGEGTISELDGILSNIRERHKGPVVFFIDQYFRDNPSALGTLPHDKGDQLIYVSTVDEPITEDIDQLAEKVSQQSDTLPSALVGIGGGSTLDTTKAISNLLTNKGKAEDYQGWDLVRLPGVYKIGIPTLSGTGAETTRTCIMTNKANRLKLGMNSDHTVFNQLILDPDLTSTVPHDQYFYTGMDAWIHCLESLSGSYRNPVGDAFSIRAMELCREVFDADDMMSATNRGKLMVASYLGGSAIASSYVGIVHPFSAGLSVVLGLHHCLSNCITMNAMESFYPDGYSVFSSMRKKQNVKVPQGICSNLSDAQFNALYQSTIIHEKPLTNALGSNFREILTEEKVRNIFEKM